MPGGMHDGVHGGGWCMYGRGNAWQERRPLQQTVCILLDAFLFNIEIVHDLLFKRLFYR